jgi:hypothetical protein
MPLARSRKHRRTEHIFQAALSLLDRKARPPLRV